MTSIRAWSLNEDILEMVPGKERQETEILITVAKGAMKLLIPVLGTCTVWVPLLARGLFKIKRNTITPKNSPTSSY